jgi:ABC-type Fe3+-hydroxamate transport system substrate-binding protein
LVVAIIAYQFAVYINKDVTLFHEVLVREENEKSLVFYKVLEQDYLPRIQTDEQLKVFRDVRMYFPEDPRWNVRTYWNSKYTTIEKIKPDIIILWSQRILDYTSKSALENAVNPASFQDTYTFFVDADNDQIRGYRLVYRDSEGLMFVSDAIYERYFKE